jgi:hypothetical protein
VQAGAKVIATKVFLFEIQLRKRMRAVHDRLDASRARHFADGFHRRDLTGDVDLMRYQDQPGAVGDPFFERRGNLFEVLRRNRNLDQL